MWTLDYEQAPISLNRERNMHWSYRNRATQEWRQAFAVLARAQHVPHLDAIHLDVHVTMRGKLQDVVNCYPSAKAAIDGLIDAGVIPDDDPAHLLSVRFWAPTRGDNCMRLVITPA